MAQSLSEPESCTDPTLFLGARSHVALRVWVPYVAKRLGGRARRVVRSWVKITQGVCVI